MADKQPRRAPSTAKAAPAASHDRPAAAVSPAAAPKAKAPPAPPPPPAGLFPNLGMKDETGDFGKMSSGNRTVPTAGIVEHRTESPTMESARNSYRKQVKTGGSIGAHYLIGQNGDTSLTVPTDKNPSHVRGNLDKGWKGANEWAIGIENVGMPTLLDGGKDMHEQVGKLNLTPAMRKRLLAKDEKSLKESLADTDDKKRKIWAIHEDIPGPQKRANQNLVTRLTAEHNLDPVTQVRGHEQVDSKTTGEGEPIIEFLAAMRDIPSKIAALEARIAKMEADPAASPQELTKLKALLAKEKASRAAVEADKTPAENLALEGEKTLAPEGVAPEGPAHAREADRADFYDHFWDRKQGLDSAAGG